MTNVRASERDPARADAAEHNLTPRQLEILALLKAGKANKDIAHELGIGIGTVKQHVVALFKKLNVTNRAMAVGKGYQLAGRSGGEAEPAALGNAVGSGLELRAACVLSLAAEGGDAEDWRLLQAAVINATADGDAVMVARPASGVDVIFGLSRTREDDAARALAAARAVAEQFATGRRAGAEAPPLAAGLASGYLVASIERAGGWTGETVAGRLIGDARALRAEAAGGTIALDATAARMLAFAHRAEDGEEPPEDGLRLPLRGGRRRRRAAPPEPATLFGRGEELDALVARIEPLRAGKGALVWLEGEAGMGKTTLGRAFGARCRDAGLGWIECRCAAEGGVATALLAAAGLRGRAPADGAAEAVRRLVAERPLALLVDDVHLASDADARVVAALAAATREIPLLLVYAGRSLRPAPLRDLAVDETVKLSRLPAEAIAATVRACAGARLKSATIDAIAALAHGVPLFATELCREALHQGEAARAGATRVPLTLVSLVMSRIDALGLDRALLRLVARTHLAAVTELEAVWPGTPEALHAEIDRAVRAGILRHGAGDKEGTLGFTHPMLQPVLSHVLMANQNEPALARQLVPGTMA